MSPAERIEEYGIAQIKSGSKPTAEELAQKTFFLMGAQEETGVYFDVEKATKLFWQIDDEMKEIEGRVEPKLPKRALNKGETKAWTPPTVQFKKDGTPSANCYKWFDIVDKDGEGKWYGKKEGMRVSLPHHEPLISEIQMRLSNQQQLKEWFVKNGWKPTMWNYKKDAKGRPVRPLQKTSPKLQDKGELCPNLLTVDVAEDILHDVIRYLSLRNRRSVLWNPTMGTGWLSHPRLSVDARLPSGSSGVTNTHRQKHRIVANIPRITSLLGREFRSLFCASPGNVLVGYDASGLEARCEAHWTYRYDNGAYAKELLDGDVHSKNAEIFNCSRDIAKNGKYALTYGSQPPTLAGTIHCSVPEAREYFANFWEKNWPLRMLRDNLEAHWIKNDKKGIVCPLTGWFLRSRSKHSLVNLLFQHTGAIIMDLANHIMDQYLGGLKWTKQEGWHYILNGCIVKRVIFYHDEVQWECNPKVADEVLRLGCESIRQAGVLVGFKVPLDANGAIGESWADTH